MDINLSKLADGAVEERFQIELQKVLDNIMDPNTSAKKARKLQLTLTFKTDEDRDITGVDIEAKTVLAPAAPIITKILMDRDSHGHAVGAEFQQTRLFNDTPKQGPQEVNKVSYLNQK